MYYFYGISRPSLRFESTNSMIVIRVERCELCSLFTFYPSMGIHFYWSTYNVLVFLSLYTFPIKCLLLLVATSYMLMHPTTAICITIKLCRVNFHKDFRWYMLMKKKGELKGSIKNPVERYVNFKCSHMPCKSSQ